MRRVTALALLLAALAAACGERGSGDGTSGIEGIALIGPTCPVEVEGSPCPDRPYPNGEVRVIDRATGEVVATFTTDEDGRFRVALPPGDYMIEGVPPEGRPLPIAAPMDVTVPEGKYVEVTISFDSGIR